MVPAPFHSPGIPSTRQTCRIASKKPFTRSVRNIPWSHTQTTSPSNERIAAVDILRTQGMFAGWQHTFGGGFGKSAVGRTGCVCSRVFTTSNGVTARVLESVVSLHGMYCTHSSKRSRSSRWRRRRASRCVPSWCGGQQCGEVDDGAARDGSRRVEDGGWGRDEVVLHGSQACRFLRAAFGDGLRHLDWPGLPRGSLSDKIT